MLEIGLRVFTVFPVNLSSNKILDEKLGYKVDPTLNPDIDDAGFRNSELKSIANLVALGDSHTFGFNVASEDSWPQQLARMLNKTVYNFGVGGYGILQYQFLMNEAIKMKPEHIVLGLYLPNDLGDVCWTLREVDFWKIWAKKNDINIEVCPPYKERKLLDKSWRSFMVNNTALGSIVKHFIWTPMKYRIKQTEWSRIAVVVSDERNKTFINYKRIVSHESAMDLGRPDIALAFEIAKEFVTEASTKADFNHISFIVLFIPSKERVFYKYLVAQGVQLPQSYHQLAKNERELVTEMSLFLEKIGIVYVDALPYMVEVLHKFGHVYPVKDDGHPLKIGYGAYAKAVYDILAR